MDKRQEISMLAWMKRLFRRKAEPMIVAPGVSHFVVIGAGGSGNSKHADGLIELKPGETLTIATTVGAGGGSGGRIREQDKPSDAPPGIITAATAPP